MNALKALPVLQRIAPRGSPSPLLGAEHLDGIDARGTAGGDPARGTATNDMLNREWVEFKAVQNRNLHGDVLSHITFDRLCKTTGSDELLRFGTGELKAGRRVRVHTGRGSNYWDGDTYHMYAGRSWYVWNNACGDRATLSYDSRVIDSAFYRPNPPEGILVRMQGTDELVPAGQLSYRRVGRP